METKDLELLEFPRIRAIIAGYCSFSLSRAMALSLAPSSDFNRVKVGLLESAEARQLLEEEGSLDISGIEDIRDSVRSAAQGKVLDSKILGVVRTSLQVMRLLRSKISQRSACLPVLGKIAAAIGDFGAIEKAIDRVISPDGEILPDASDKLVSIRYNQRTRRAELVAKLQNLIASDSHHRFIQEPIVTEREGRFVIAVKSESRKEVEGVVHDVSNSGATLFIEPLQTLELGNALKEEQIEEKREIERILTKLSERVGMVSEGIVSGIEAAAAIDLALAKARYARRFQATEAAIYQPTTSEPPIVCLDAARHPLLGDGVVPLTLELGGSFSILVITGPNTGGKTVALKTIGLLCLMTQAGLPIPAGVASRLPVLDGIFADIGDEQSIQETLSTFSWHMGNISRILKKAQGYNLVLLDELGASTDPREGSALARAILLHLLVPRFLAAITTHYTELKVFAHVTPGLQNASFDFDPQTLNPTYHLTLGTPGGSNAIATAVHLGLPEEITTTAHSLLDQGAQQLETLLANLQAEKQRLEVLSCELAAEKGRLERQNGELAAELQKLRNEKQQIIQNARDNVIAEMSRLQKELKQAAAALKRERSLAAVKDARQASQIVREQLKSGVLREPDEPVNAEDNTIAIGDSVWIKEVGIKARVISINEKANQVEVAAGSLNLKADRDNIVKVTDSEKSRQISGVQIRIAPKTMSLELDLRGRRAEEVELLLDRYLNDAAVADLREVRIIHGFGTGTVRSMVRELAARHPLVRSFCSPSRNEGGDGVTVIQLK